MALTRRTQNKLVAPLAAACVLVAVPAAALAGPSGGGGLPSGGSGVSGTAAPGAAPAKKTNPRVHLANRTLSASGNGITVQTLSSGETTGALTFSGTVPAHDAGRAVQIDRRSGTARRQTWIPVAAGAVAADGTYSAVWRSTRSGRFQVKAVLLAGALTAASDTASTGPQPAPVPTPSPSTSGAVAPTPSPAPATAPPPSSPPLTIEIFQASVATLYGPGFYGRRTACGQTLHRSTIGVASRTLRCGARVAILYGGRVMSVPVIDRGPYANGAAWDLTMAAAHALGIPGTATIGALTLSRH